MQLEREQDFEVVAEAADGEQAVELALKLKPDVVVMDISMPKLSGIEATKQIKAVLSKTAILALTAYEYDQYVFALLEAGAAGYLLKDVTTQELTGAIRSVHRGDSVLHPAVARKVIQKLSAGKETVQRPVESLTDREHEVLSLAAQGLRNKDIAKQLFVSVRTVEAHLTSILSKLQVDSRIEAVLLGLKTGLVSLAELNERQDTR
jgi:two-component system, NarL family, response regulator LiaR